MEINRKNPDGWNADIDKSVDFYNQWFLRFAPATYREERKDTTRRVRKAFAVISDGRDLQAESFLRSPEILTILRQMTCPPLARDRLAGLAGVSRSVVKHFEDGGHETPTCRCAPILDVISSLLDVDLMPWIGFGGGVPTPAGRRMASLVVADRLCGALSDPIIRNAQEQRQLASIASFLNAKGYIRCAPSSFEKMRPGEYAFHLNIQVVQGGDQDRRVNIPVDVAILPKSAVAGDFPIIIEAKSAGDFTNVNKRRKEEAQKMAQLKRTYREVVFLLFLCGYFDTGYLGYEAAEGIDWIWEHRISDMEKLGL